MDEHDIARLVEGSEARAYASLVGGQTLELQRLYGLDTSQVGSALAVHARAITNSLNMNRIIGLGVFEPATEAMLDELTLPYADNHLSFGVEFCPCAQPAQLPDWLRTRRLRRATLTAVHYRAADRLDGPPTPLEVVQTSDGDVVAAICCEVFRMPAAAQSMIRATAAMPQWRHWLARREGVPVAAALSFVQDGVAWLGWDATLPQARGLGAQSALIARRVSEAADAGCHFVTTETAANTSAHEDPSWRNYRRAGFVQAYERPTYVGMRRVAP